MSIRIVHWWVDDEDIDHEEEVNEIPKEVVLKGHDEENVEAYYDNDCGTIVVGYTLFFENYYVEVVNEPLPITIKEI